MSTLLTTLMCSRYTGETNRRIGDVDPDHARDTAVADTCSAWNVFY